MSVHYLLAWGANINAQDKAGYTPLHLAVKAALQTKSDYLIIKLVMKGADKNIKDCLGRTPISLLEHEENLFGEQKEIRSLIKDHLVSKTFHLIT